MKSKIWLYYLVMNIALVGFTGWLSYRVFFPGEIVYAEPVILLEDYLAYGDKLRVMDPAIIDLDETEPTHTLTLANNAEEDKTFYLYLEVTGDSDLINNLTVKMKDKTFLFSYQPNGSIKKFTLAPGEYQFLSIKVYIDLLQVLNTDVFVNKAITLRIIDDQMAFYGLSTESTTTDKTPPDDNPADDS